MPPNTPPSERRSQMPPRESRVWPRERRSGSALGIALIAAALLHIPIVAALPFLLRASQPPVSRDLQNTRDFRLSLVTEETKSQDTKRAEQKEKLRDEREGQFISLDAPEVEETPDEARFLDQFASKAEQETLRKQNALPKTKPASPAPPTPATPKKPTPRPAEERPASPTPERPATPEPQKSAATQDDQPADREPEETAKSPIKRADEGISRAEPSEDFAKESPARPHSPGDLFPSSQNAPAMAGDGSFDYLSDVEEGEKTLLNRKRSRYWSFMNRLKEGVAQEWSPMEEYRRRDPHGKVYGVKDRYTVLRVTLNGDGSLRTIHVAKSSGLKFYDDEAVRSMRAAAPFQNPPEGLKDSDGLIQFSFGLLLDVSRGTVRGFRIRR